ncbi:hypothetical protein [Streptomyces mirabilis]|uniref:hypothetical protein n=1 Tax=Streptomyces mirabilis TaxID=68239 RepID=UPI00331EFE9E
MPDPGLGEQGRGLRLVDQLAVKWGCTYLGRREKRVWAVLEVPQGLGCGRGCAVIGFVRVVCVWWGVMTATFAPGRGRHRAMASPRATPARARMRTFSARLWSPPYPPERPRCRRQAYDVPLVDDASPLVRPYLIAHEQRDRRRELALALLEQDGPGPHVIHGVEVA